MFFRISDLISTSFLTIISGFSLSIGMFVTATLNRNDTNHPTSPFRLQNWLKYYPRNNRSMNRKVDLFTSSRYSLSRRELKKLPSQGGIFKQTIICMMSSQKDMNADSDPSRSFSSGILPDNGTFAEVLHFSSMDESLLQSKHDLRDCGAILPRNEMNNQLEQPDGDGCFDRKRITKAPSQKAFQFYCPHTIKRGPRYPKVWGTDALRVSIKKVIERELECL